jgi:hypothetical protein
MQAGNPRYKIHAYSKHGFENISCAYRQITLLNFKFFNLGN